MKHGRGFFIGALVTLALVAILALLAAGGDGALAQGTTIYVDADATSGMDNGYSWEDAFLQLYDALDVAVAGDQIWVAAGTYKPTSIGDRTASFWLINGVAIYGGFDPTVGDVAWGHRDWVSNVTILSGDLNGDDGPDFANNGENSYHVFYHPVGMNLGSTAILNGFTIWGGNANGASPHDVGGGMYNNASSPALTNCIFEANWAAVGGGGMYNRGTMSTLTDCSFMNNYASYGGGMNNYGGMPMLFNCTFTNNSADEGGGVFNYGSSGQLENCHFLTNHAEVDGGGMYNTLAHPALTNCTFESNDAVNFGGGIYNRHGSEPTLTDCSFLENTAYKGGGMYNEDAEPMLTLTNCTFVRNVADDGGGMYNRLADLTLINCTFWANETGELGLGAGIFNYGSSPTLTNCTFAKNTADVYGGAIANVWASPVLTNCILWGDTGPEIFDSGSSPVVTYSDVEGGYIGTGNIDVDPLFVDMGMANLHLGSGSPCIDAGSNGAPNLPLSDFEGDPRKLDGNGDGWAVVDMGVDEYVPLFPAPLFVIIDITPSVPSNVIKLSSPRPVPVAILGAEEFSVSKVAADTVVFAGALHAGFAYADVDGDDLLDLVLDFYPEQMDELTLESKEATLTGETLEGGLFEGTDKVKVRE